MEEQDELMIEKAVKTRRKWTDTQAADLIFKIESVMRKRGVEIVPDRQGTQRILNEKFGHSIRAQKIYEYIIDRLEEYEKKDPEFKPTLKGDPRGEVKEILGDTPQVEKVPVPWLTRNEN